MRTKSLESNNSGELWLLGNASSAVSFADVRTAFLEAWEQALTLHSQTLSTMDEVDLKEIDLWRNGKLDSIPEYGSLEEKSALINSLKNDIQQLSSELAVQSNAEDKMAKIEGIGERETTRRIMLAQAQSDIKSQIISESEYQKIIKLIGLQGSLFTQQLTSLSTYGDNYQALFRQLDQTLAAARDEIKKTEGRESLAGGYFGATARQDNIDQIRRATSHLGTSIGDGIRSTFGNPDHIGVGVPAARGDGTYFPGGIFQPWIGTPEHLMQNGPTQVDPETIDPRAVSREGFTTGNPEAPSSRPGSPYERGVSHDNLFGTRNSCVKNALNGSRLTGVSQNGQLGNAGWSPQGMGGSLSDVTGIDPTKNPLIAVFNTAVVLGLGGFGIAAIAKGLGSLSKSRGESKMMKTASKRDKNPEVEIEYPGDDDDSF